METLNITQSELNQIKYNDDCIKNMKTEKQKLAIEFKEREQRRKRYDKAVIQAGFKVPPKRTWFNHIERFVLNNEITEEMEEKEVQYFVMWD